ncbi:hypothetical protein GCM10009785_26790 [Brooklawnia cerclae]|uniref:Uncharacterized protein n=1 Tax=Brooklawnia cerclae TaxID=349934 RepID=A0ABX0SG04_9ACTN|nr:hypothetical protein [Brooklawnia cerclae]NIH57312.1 hypothetical protein [Brooklawnia cerclae]
MPKSAALSTVSISEAVGSVDASKPGRLLIRIIDEGEGASGYYPAATLEAAATDRVFPKGTHVYLDHATAIRRGPNGERSVRDLVGTLAEDARYVPEAKALDAEVSVRPSYRQMVSEIAPDVGLSISASAQIGAPMPGQTARTITRIVEAESVDLVVAAGRGGAVLQVIESAIAGATEATADDRRRQLEQAVAAAYRDPENDVWAGLRDFDPDTQVAYIYISDRLYAQPYEASDDGLTVTLTGERTEVAAVTTYVPVAPAGLTETQPTKEAAMPEIPQERLDALLEAEKRVGALESEHAALVTRAETAETERDSARTKLAESARRAEIEKKVTAACEGKPAAMLTRVAERIPADAEDLDKAVAEALAAEQKYLASLTESRISGFGPSTTTDTPSGKHRTLWDK